MAVRVCADAASAVEVNLDSARHEKDEAQDETLETLVKQAVQHCCPFACHPNAAAHSPHYGYL